MADNVQAVNDANFQADVIEASKTQPVMVDFWADWCRPCHMLSPTVEEIAPRKRGQAESGESSTWMKTSMPPGNSISAAFPRCSCSRAGRWRSRSSARCPKNRSSRSSSATFPRRDPQHSRIDEWCRDDAREAATLVEVCPSGADCALGTPPASPEICRKLWRPRARVCGLRWPCSSRAEPRRTRKGLSPRALSRPAHQSRARAE